MRPCTLASIFTTLTFVAITACADQELNSTDTVEAPWQELFNGKDLAGWKISENKEAVYIEDGCLVTHGERAHAFYVGKEDGKEIYKNFRLRAEVKTEPKANSGIYFHTKFQDSGWPSKGYEAQVNNSHDDAKKTGGLYSVQDNFTPPVKDGEWFTYEIVVQGKSIRIEINGKTISDYTEPEDLNRPKRQLDANGGLIALQAHDPGSKVWYRSIKVQRLPDEAN